MIDVLRTTIRVYYVPLREVERRLGMSKGYLTRLFSGVIALRFDHVTAIADAIGADPAEILRQAFPPSQQPPSPAALRIREELGWKVPAEAQSPATSEESPLEKAIEQAVARAVAKMLDRALP
jgi:transcriptional regulator with XRE-family HTH domain